MLADVVKQKQEEIKRQQQAEIDKYNFLYWKNLE